MCFVDQDDDAFAALGPLVGEQLVRLRDQGGGVEARLAAEGAHDLVVEAARADARVGEVDDGVPGGVEGGDGGAGGDGLAGADLAGQEAERLLFDHEGDAGERLLVGARAVEGAGRDLAVEGQPGEAVVGLELGEGHGVSSFVCESGPAGARSR